MNIRSAFFVIACTLTINNLQSQDITENKFGKGLFNVVAEDSSYSAKFTVRMQSLFTSGWEVPVEREWGAAETNMLIRRARLKFEGFAYSAKLEYKFQLGLSNRDMSGYSPFTRNTPRFILDALVKWNFYDNLELWVGQTKLPGNREQLISSGSLETVDRSLVNSYFNLGRDMGVQLHHSFLLGEDFIIREAVSVAQGEGRNVTEGNLGGHQYTVRGEILPFGDFDDYSGADLDREETPKLALGVSYDYNNNAVRTESNSGDYLFTDYGLFETDIKTLFVDAMFKYEGFSLMGEYAQRSADEIFAINEDNSFTGGAVNVGEGFNFQAGYLFGNNIQMVGRYSRIDLDDCISQVIEDQYTLALSKYLVGHKLKIQTDLSYTDLNPLFDDSLLFRLQLEVQF